MTAILDDDHRYAAVHSRDSRFDGWFVTAVATTRIYCRPSCPAITPKRVNVSFYPSAAAAQQAGYRACLRCLPDAAPGSPEWNLRADLVGRAMRLIADGVVDRDGVAGLARRLGYSERQVHRQLLAELGAGPLALARAQRAQTARILIETTTMPFTDVAFAAGFASVRQFNDTVQEVFARTPSALRAARVRPSTAPAGRLPAGVTTGAGAGAATAAAAADSAAWTTLVLRLPVRRPFDGAALLAFLAARAVHGVEEVTAGTYRRVLRLPHGHATVALTPTDGPVVAVLRLADLRDLAAAVHRCHRLLDLDADPTAVDAALAADPALAPLVAAAPGRRVPGAVDGAELAVRAVLGQQVSVAAARTIAGRLAAAYGRPLTAPDGALTHAFPTSAALAALDPGTLPMPATRARAVVALAAADASGALDLDPGADRAATERALLALPGIGPWTAGYVALRALGDPDAFLPGDLVLRRAAAALGITDLTVHAERWRPWRAYAAMHLWAYDSTHLWACDATHLWACDATHLWACDATHLWASAPSPEETP